MQSAEVTDREASGREPVARSAAVLTAGCRLNQSESDALRGRLADLGFRVVSEPERADSCFVNTCTVTAAADRSSIQLIRRACRLVPKPKVVVLGCLAQRSPNAVQSIPGVDEVWDNLRKQAELSGACPTPLRSRALLKVQDGCDRSCGYCVVSGLRGSPVSVPAAAALSRFERLVQDGFHEVVLTGLNLGLYQDERGLDLAGLLRTLLDCVSEPDFTTKTQSLKGENGHRRQSQPQRHGDSKARTRAGGERRTPNDERQVRIRLGSLEPDTVNDGMLRVIADERIAPHFHLALQSGDDRVLSSMGRRYDGAGFLTLVTAIRRARPDANIGLDVIVGLPGEDAASFERTRQLIAELAPGYLHVFPFSPRPGTPAAQMGDVASVQERKQRVRNLRELSAGLRRDYQMRFAGTVRSAVVESCQTALTDNYLRVSLEQGCAATPRSMIELSVFVEQGRLVGRSTDVPVSRSESRQACLSGFPSVKEAV